MMDVLEGLYQVVLQRQQNPQEGSYTCYLLDQGLDKILKKCGEECSETIIAAKNHNPDELANEMSDLLYHLVVLLVSQGMSLQQVSDILRQRSQKIGNLKQFHQTNKDS